MWAEQLRPDRITVHAMHPVGRTHPALADHCPRCEPLLRNREQGVDTLVWLAADDGAPVDTTGLFWLDRRPRPIDRLSSTRRFDTAEERDRLWDWCIQLWIPSMTVERISCADRAHRKAPRLRLLSSTGRVGSVAGA
jgi:hypothetical protein